MAFILRGVLFDCNFVNYCLNVSQLSNLADVHAKAHKKLENYRSLSIFKIILTD